MATVTVTFTITELCLRTGVSEEELTEIVGLGMIEPHQPQADTWLFDDSAVTIVHRAVRLRNELELDWPGIAVALTLLDENARLTREIACCSSAWPASSPTDRATSRVAAFRLRAGWRLRLIRPTN